VLYLGGGFNRCSVFQQKFNDFDSVLLARNVQRRETVLRANKSNYSLSPSLMMRQETALHLAYRA